MKLYNSLSKQIEDIKPIKPGQLGIYSCGPTVYNHAHIGNLLSYIWADILRRTAKLDGTSIKHVMNITDVDDKTIRDSQDNFPDLKPMEALIKFTDKYHKLFIDDLTKLNFDVSAMQIVSARASIVQIQEIINSLITRNIAYLSDDGIYLSISAFQKAGYKYGVLENIAINKQQARIKNDEYDKDQAADFAIWKKQKDNEPAWKFTVKDNDFTGRPGWHIECSAMSTANLGQPFDIHTGGIDLKFPHHENEIAQSVATGNGNFCNCFMHSEHLLVDGGKMSKSKNNFYKLSDIVEKGIDPIAFRLLVLQGHYQHRLNFSFDSLFAAQTFLFSIYGLADRQFQPNGNSSILDVKAILTKSREKITRYLENNLSMAQALSELSKIVDQFGEQPLDKNQTVELQSYLSFIDSAFGLPLINRIDISNSIKHKIAQREQARNEKQFIQSDDIRKQLEENDDIKLLDKPFGVIWQRTTATS
ncbi:cysteine--tRNA ligase [Candidatus Saccharibacteria bacterium]|jgi:cysteinyl-tRNA synthetase|nr:cysteine--tRNA ligase [Candidatus Saccharibacteria bacterium]